MPLINNMTPRVNPNDNIYIEMIQPYLNDLLNNIKSWVTDVVTEGLTPDQIDQIVNKALEAVNTVTSTQLTESMYNEMTARIQGDSNADAKITLTNDDLDLHKLTDISRWQNFYNTERMVLISIVKAAGAMEDIANKVSILVNNIDNPYIVESELGGIVDLTAENQGTTFPSLIVNGETIYSANGIRSEGTLTKSVLVNKGDIIYAINTDEITFTPVIPDPNDKLTTLETKVDNFINVATGKWQLIDNLRGTQVKFVVADTQYQTQVSTPTSNGVQLVTATELLLHQEYDQTYLTDLATQITNMQFTDEQKQQLANEILAVAGANAVTASQMATALNAAIVASNTPQTTVLDNANCHLLFAKYPDGRMEITGTIQNDGIQVIFPEGWSFIDSDTIGMGCIYSGLDDQSNSIMHVGKAQIATNQILWKASSFGVAILGGGAVSDDGQYSITVTGRWK